MSQAGFFSDSGGGGGGDVETLTPNTGGAVSPDGSGNINIVGSGGGLEGIVTTGTTNTITISLTETTYSGTATTSPGFPVQDLNVIIPVALNNSMSIRANIVGRDIASGESIGGEILVTFHNSAGTVTICGGADTTVNRDADLINSTFTAIPSGSNVLIRVTGENDLTMHWKGIINVVTVS